MISAPSLLIVGGPDGLSLDRLSFAELGGINSEINIEQYVSVDSAGMVNHTKQMGLTRPPTVTLKRGVDSNLALWYWHNMAVMGLPTARTNVTLEMYGGGNADDRRRPSRCLPTPCCQRVVRQDQHRRGEGGRGLRDRGRHDRLRSDRLWRWLIGPSAVNERHGKERRRHGGSSQWQSDRHVARRPS